MLQFSWAVVVSALSCCINSALTITIPQARPCSMGRGDTSPSPLPLPGWAGDTVCLALLTSPLLCSPLHPLLTKMVGHWLKVGPVIYSPCCSSVREVQ